MGVAEMAWISATAIGTVLVYTGLAKARSLSEMRTAVEDYAVLPARLAAPVGLVLPAVELTLGVLILTGIASGISGGIAALLFLGFFVGVLVNLARNRDMDCHCTGIIGERLGVVTASRLVSLILLAGLSTKRTSAVWELPRDELVPIFASGTAVAIILMLVGAMPEVARWLRTEPVRSASRNGGRVSLRHYPLMSVEQEGSSD